MSGETIGGRGARRKRAGNEQGQRETGERSYELLGVRKVVVARSKEWDFVIALMFRLNLDSGEVDINY